ncbi:MAG: hypothetical protein IKL77_05325 [Clostridia bacterium]|nr:hypothetical protein [Clostridia bacterium]
MYNGRIYGLCRDADGSISRIFKDGRVLCEYHYDAWGNCETEIEPINELMAEYLGEQFLADEQFVIENNPFRWKGFYYDADNAVYRINGRCYSPTLMQYLQPDLTTITPETTNGLDLYCFANNNPVSIWIGGISGGNSGANYGKLSNSSNILGALGSLINAFAFFDQWSSCLSGGLDAGLNYWGPEGFGLQFLGKYSSLLKKFGIGMTVVSNALSLGSSIYNNINNPNYTTAEAIGASFMDAAYYTVKGLGSYWLGNQLGKVAATVGIAAGSAVLGTTVFGTTIGFVGALAIGGGVTFLVGMAGAVAIYYLGELIDNGWEWLKKQIFE